MPIVETTMIIVGPDAVPKHYPFRTGDTYKFDISSTNTPLAAVMVNTEDLKDTDYEAGAYLVLWLDKGGLNSYCTPDTAKTTIFWKSPSKKGVLSAHNNIYNMQENGWFWLLNHRVIIQASDYMKYMRIAAVKARVKSFF